MEAGRQRQFRIHHCLGRGGYGEVYRATMVAPGGISSDVAVKLLRVDVDPGGEAVRRLRDEGRLLSVVRHPAILRVFDLALLDGRIGLVTEYVEGEDLSALIGQLPQRACLEVAAAVAEALDAAWNDPGPDGQPLRLVHRDIKPSNVRIGRRGEVKVLDFGIARSMAEESDREARTGTGSTVGSLAYMAPERFARTPAAPAADVFGLGCCLYELFAGRRLFEDAVPVEMFRLAAEAATFEAHLAEALARIDGIHPKVRALVASMLAYDPAARPTAAEVRATAEALEPQAGGDTLKQWARGREWPGNQSVAGYLEGRVITEGTLSSGAFEASAGDDRSAETFKIDLGPSLSTRPDPPALAPRRWVAPGSVAGIVVVVLVLCIAAVLSPGGGPGPSPALSPSPPGGGPGPTPSTPPEPALSPSPPGGGPGPSPSTPPEPALSPSPPEGGLPPEPALPPSPPEGGPSPALSPSPPGGGPGWGPSAGTSDPAEVPPPLPDLPEQSPDPLAADPPPPGRVAVQPDTVRIELHAPGGRVEGLGEVPPGRYELFADFGYGLSNVGKLVDVVSDYQTVIRCNTLRHTCDVAN